MHSSIKTKWQMFAKLQESQILNAKWKCTLRKSFLKILKQQRLILVFNLKSMTNLANIVCGIF